MVSVTVYRIGNGELVQLLIYCRELGIKRTQHLEDRLCVVPIATAVLHSILYIVQQNQIFQKRNSKGEGSTLFFILSLVQIIYIFCIFLSIRSKFIKATCPGS